MESKEAEKAEIEGLAEIKAKRRLDSWSERFKAIWYILLVLWSVVGFFALLILWIGVLGGGIKTTLAVFVTVGIFILGGVFYDQNKTWKKARLREFYEEELLELKMKK